MNDAEQKAPQHGGHQLLLRVKPRIQPYFRQSDEIVPYDIDYVSEKLPNIIPQNIVEIPQYIYIITVFRFCPSGLHLSKINSVAKTL